MDRFLEASTKPSRLSQLLVTSPESATRRFGVILSLAVASVFALISVAASGAAAGIADPAQRKGMWFRCR
jgi:hypothetical protein